MKKLFSILVFMPMVLCAQNTVDFESFDVDVNKPITGGIIGKSVLVVPFSSDLYNNQESEYIVRASKINYEQSINYFKSSLDSAIVNALSDSCKVISMLTNFTQATSSDLDKIHGAANYYMTERPALTDSKKKNNLFEDKFAKNKKSNNQQKSGIINGEVVSVKEDLSNKYMCVKFEDKDFINSMSLKYGARYLLFVTELDIIGDFSNPYAVAQKTYDRIIRAHYCIFDNSGKFITGDVLEQRFSAKNDQITNICTNNFPVLASKIVKKLP